MDRTRTPRLIALSGTVACGVVLIAAACVAATQQSTGGPAGAGGTESRVQFHPTGPLAGSAPGSGPDRYAVAGLPRTTPPAVLPTLSGTLTVAVRPSPPTAATTVGR